MIRGACPAQLAPPGCIEVAHRQCRSWPSVEIMLVADATKMSGLLCARDARASHRGRERNSAADRRRHTVASPDRSGLTDDDKASRPPQGQSSVRTGVSREQRNGEFYRAERCAGLQPLTAIVERWTSSANTTTAGPAPGPSPGLTARIKKRFGSACWAEELPVLQTSAPCSQTFSPYQRMTSCDDRKMRGTSSTVWCWDHTTGVAHVRSSHR